MLERFSQKINGTLRPNRSIWIYSTHYYMIANILNGLEVFDVIQSALQSVLKF